MAKKVDDSIKIVTDTAGLNRLIKSIGNNKLKLEAQIVAACIGVVFHAAEHSDCTLATRLVKALGEKGSTGIRTDAVMKWLETYGAMRWSETDTGKQFRPHKEEMAALRDRIEADRGQVLLDLQEKNPWNLKPLPEYEGFEFMKELEKLIAKAKRKMVSDKEHQKAKEHGVELNFDGMKEADKFFGELSAKFGPRSNVEGKALH